MTPYANNMNPTALCLLLGLGLLAGCAADRPLRTPDVAAALRNELASAPPVATPGTVPASISAALAEPPPPPVALPPEPRLDLLVNNAQAREVFLAIVADTRYSMLMHPDVSGTLSVTLRGVTVKEALEAIRDVYGYDFKIDGRRITIYAPTLQTRIFTINYPNAQRVGVSDLRISSGAMPTSANGAPNTGTATNSGAVGASGTGAGGSSSSQIESSRVSTNSRTDLWGELTDAVRSMIGAGVGRNVTTSPQAGIMAVRAMPEELRQVEKFLKAAQIAVERQVMLEAKIVEVELRDGFQSGIDWSALRNTTNATGAIGSLGGGTANNVLINGVKSNLPGFPLGTTPALADVVSLPIAGGGLFGLALATDGFQAVLGFLETRGDLQILSSPRIATMNNQKALLKVGTDEFFVTNVSGGTNTTTGTNNNNLVPTMPTLTLTPFFSGIALDVTPQIDDTNNITLHVRPSVTSVTEKTKQIDLGSVGNYRLPLASSAVNESDTMVRIQDGNIVAIGGLMQLESNRSASGMPGSGDIPMLSSLLGNRVNSGRKKELVVLIKPTIIRSAQDWEQQTRLSRAALDDMDTTRNRVIQLDGTLEQPKPKNAVQ
jgi:MSHA biogenesis protein MshL